MTVEGPSKGAGESAEHTAEPIHAVIAGVPVVTIPLAHYVELLAASKAAGGASPALPPTMAKLSDTLDKVRAGRKPRRKPLPSTIERDPEVAAFLRERFRHADTLERAHAGCRERFGAERTPSTSRIERFRTKVRDGA